MGDGNAETHHRSLSRVRLLPLSLSESFLGIFLPSSLHQPHCSPATREFARTSRHVDRLGVPCDSGITSMEAFLVTDEARRQNWDGRLCPLDHHPSSRCRTARGQVRSKRNYADCRVGTGTMIGGWWTAGAVLSPMASHRMASIGTAHRRPASIECGAALYDGLACASLPAPHKS